MPVMDYGLMGTGLAATPPPPQLGQPQTTQVMGSPQTMGTTTQPTPPPPTQTGTSSSQPTGLVGYSQALQNYIANNKNLAVVDAPANTYGIGTGESYYDAKLRQLGATGHDITGMTAADIKAYFDANGITPEQHYAGVGWKEGLGNPNPNTTITPPVNTGGTGTGTGTTGGTGTGTGNTGTVSTTTTSSGATVTKPSMNPSTTLATPHAVSSVPAQATQSVRKVTPSETVSSQLMNLIKADSPYIQSARNKGMEAANERGLINSGLAAGISERAAIDASLPIAQQDASTYAASGLSAQNANQQAVRDEYAAKVTSAQNLESAGYNSALATQNSNAAANLAAQNATATSALAAQNASSASALATQNAASTLELNKYLKQMDAQIAQMQAQTNTQGSMSQDLTSMQQTVMNQIAAIQQTSNQIMSPEDKATANAMIMTQFQQYVSSLSSLNHYTASVTWV